MKRTILVLAVLAVPVIASADPATEYCRRRAAESFSFGQQVFDDCMVRVAKKLRQATVGSEQSRTIPYGSRVGMELTILREEGLDTENASISTIHTRQNAIKFCKEYIGKVTPRCIQDEMAIKLASTVFANCSAGVFTNFYGARFKFAGVSIDNENSARYRLINLDTGEEADGSSASGYPINMSIFKYLCPTKAPSDF